jgi:hypothetical protein
MSEQPLTSVEQHHLDTITERIGLNRLNSEAAPRGEGSEPAAAEQVAEDEAAQPEMTLADAITAEAALKTLLDEVRAGYDAARAIVQAGLDEQQKANGGTRFDAMVPSADGPVKVGTVSLSSGSAAATVRDPEAFLAWARERYSSEVTPRLVFEVREAWRTDLLARATAAGAAVDTDTGEEIPGVEMRASRARTHSVRFGKGGRDLVGESWRGGYLGRVLPALVPAAEDAPDAEGGETA